VFLSVEGLSVYSFASSLSRMSSASAINVSSRLLAAFMLAYKESYEGNYVSVFLLLGFGAKSRVSLLKFWDGIRNFLDMPICLYTPAMKRMGM
jgi:hypothetical protein